MTTKAEAEALAQTRAFTRTRAPMSLWQVTSTFAALGLVLAALGRVPAAWTPALVPLISGLFVRIFVLQHDCGHHSLFAHRLANDGVGTLLSFVTGVPYETWKLEHAWHHNNQGRLSHRGIDRMNSPMTAAEARQKPANAALRSEKIGFNYIFFVGAFSLAVLRKTRHGFFQFRPEFRWPFPAADRAVRGVWITNTGHVLFHAAGVALLGWRWLALPVAMWIGAGIGSFLFWVQHNFEHGYQANDAEWSYAKVGIHGSSYLALGPVLAWFTAHIGLHHVHHLNPGIPNYRLDEARRAIPELAKIVPLSREDLRRCFTHVFWDEERQRMVSLAELDAPAEPRPVEAVRAAG